MWNLLVQIPLVSNQVACRSVLVVDDDIGSASLCAEALNSAGYKVSVAHDGVRGLAMALSRNPDLVLTDLFLPSMTGLELIQRIRSAGLVTRAILMSGAQNGRIEAFRCHADGFLAKPFEVGEALRLVGRIFDLAA